MNLMVLGSRTYCPIADVTSIVRELPADATVTGFGSCDVAERAVLAATSLGLDARHVTLDRNRLIADAKQPGARLEIFVATDPITKEATQGTAGILTMLTQEGITPTVHRSPYSGRVCVAATKLRQAVDKCLEMPSGERRRPFLLQKALAVALDVDDLRKRHEAKLDAGWDALAVADTDEAFATWKRWLGGYEFLCGELTLAESALR